MEKVKEDSSKFNGRHRFRINVGTHVAFGGGWFAMRQVMFSCVLRVESSVRLFFSEPKESEVLHRGPCIDDACVLV